MGSVTEPKDQVRQAVPTALYGFYSLVLKWPENWIKFGFRFTKQPGEVNMIWFNVQIWLDCRIRVTKPVQAVETIRNENHNELTRIYYLNQIN